MYVLKEKMETYAFCRKCGHRFKVRTKFKTYKDTCYKCTLVEENYRKCLATKN